MQQTRYRNLYTEKFTHIYTNIKPQKCKTNGTTIAINDQNSISILPIVTETQKYRKQIALQHGKAVSDFVYSPFDSFVTSITLDSLVRVWNVPKQEGEYDLVDTYLAGHEKRVMGVAYHPLSSNLLCSWSMDQTIRIWDVQTHQDKIVMDVGSIPTQSIFDPTLQCLVVGSSDGIKYFDPRSSTDPILQAEMEIAHTKGFQLLVTTWSSDILLFGFLQSGQRVIQKYDHRTLKVCSTVSISEGASLCPMADHDLQMVYVSAKGDPLRTVEYSNDVKITNTISLETPISVMNLLPKRYCNQQKFEIGKFLTVTEKGIATVGVYLPRRSESVLSDEIKVEELKPLVGDWFDVPKEEVKLQLDRQDQETSLDRLGTLKHHQKSFSAVSARSVTVKGEVQTSRSATLKGGERLLTVKEVHRSSTIASSRSSLASQEPIIPTNKKGMIELERKGWISSQWIQVEMRCKHGWLYMYEQQTLFWVSKIHPSTLLKDFLVPPQNTETGLEIIGQGYHHRLKCTTVEAKMEWLEALSPYCLQPGLPMLPMKSSHGIFMSSVELYSTTWQHLHAVLETNRTVHLYQNFIDTTPKFVIDLDDCYAITEFENGETFVEYRIVQLFMKNKVTAFRCYQDLARTWVEQILKTSNGMEKVELVRGKRSSDQKEVFIGVLDSKVVSMDNFGVLPSMFCELHEPALLEQIIFEEPLKAKLLNEIKQTRLRKWTPQFSSNPTPNIVTIQEEMITKGGQKVLYRITNDGIFPSSLTKSLDQNISWVLDAGMNIFHLSGLQASRIQRAEGLNLATSIRKYRGTKPKLKIIDEHEQEHKAEFMGHLTGPPDGNQYNVNLYRIYQSVNNEEFKNVYEGPVPSKSYLKGVSIVSVGNVFFIWSEKGTSQNTRNKAKQIVYHLSSIPSYAVYLYEEFQEMETAYLKRMISDFGSDLPISMRIDAKKGNIVRVIEQEEINVEELLGKTVPEQSIVPSGGKLDIYEISEFEKMKLNPEMFGIFCKSKSYLLCYQYKQKIGMDKCILYFWQGSKSSIIDKGTSAVIAIEMGKELSMDVQQVRVVEGKEPSDFSVFLPDQIIYVFDEEELYKRMPLLLDIRLSNKIIKVVESNPENIVPYHCALLMDNSSFVYTTTHCPPSIQEKLSLIASNPNSCKWEQFVHACSQRQLKLPPLTNIQPNARLFSVCGASGKIQVEEIYNLTQEDLSPSLVMILLTSKIYIWFGSKSKWIEKVQSIEISRKMKASQILITYPNQEPDDFIAHFQGWKCAGRKPNAVPESTVWEQLNQKEYSKEVLLSETVPEHLDRSQLETYLPPDEFKSIFGMPKQDYQQLPVWKRDTIRKSKGFF